MYNKYTRLRGKKNHLTFLRNPTKNTMADQMHNLKKERYHIGQLQGEKEKTKRNCIDISNQNFQMNNIQGYYTKHQPRRLNK